MTQQQMIDLAYVIFAKQTILQQDLRTWNRRPATERTWPNMTEHLRDAQTDLSSLPTAGDVYHQQPPHQANVATLADLVLQRLLDEQQPVEQPSRVEPSPSDPHTDAANSLQRRETDLQSREASMRTQMQEMMAMMRQGNSNNNNNNSRGGQHGGRGRGRGRGRDNDRRNNRSQPQQLYCWTHGSCAHASSGCRTQAFGHQPTATFANMMNGSNHGCYWMT
jgi:hypothetical protein